MGLLDQWNKNKFSIYKNEEKTVLKLLESISKWLEKIIIGLDGKTDLYGDHKGSWQGLNKPTLSEEGMRATVEQLINETIPHINSQMEQIIKKDSSKEINVLFPPFPLAPCDLTGKTDSTDKLKAILKYVTDNYNHTTIIIPSGEMLISDTIDIDVERISVECQAVIKCDIPSDKYALRFGYTGEYGGYTKGRTTYKGLYLINKNIDTKKGNGILFGGTNDTVGSSNINLINCIISDFTNGLSYTDRSYLIRCNNCDLYNNITQINVLGGVDTGENIRFDNCVIANGGTALLVNNALSTVYLNGCSIDYNYKQIFDIQKGDVYVDNCHIEHNSAHFTETIPFTMGDYDGNKCTITNSRVIFIESDEVNMQYIIKNDYFNNAMSYFNINNCFLQGFKTKSGYIGTGFINMYGNQCYQWENMNYKVSEEMNKINDGKFFNADLLAHKDFIKVKEPNNIEIGVKYDRTERGDNWLMITKKTGNRTNGSCAFIVPHNLLCSNYGGELQICSNKNTSVDIRFGTCRFIDGNIVMENLLYNVGQIGLSTLPITKNLTGRQLTQLNIKNDYIFMEIILYNCDENTEIYIKNMGIYEY